MNEWVNQIHTGECRDVMTDLPESSIHCCITSPPYYGLRNYGDEDQIGLEDSFEDYIGTLVDVGRSIRRVLRPDGSWWLNLGDTYSGGGGVAGKPDDWDDMHDDDNYPSDPPAKRSDISSKCKMLIPHRVAIALIDDGWIVRNDAIWRKKGGGMPESVKDRLSTTTESVFHLVPQQQYWYDLDAIREPYSDSTNARMAQNNDNLKFDGTRDRGYPGESDTLNVDQFTHVAGKNPGDLFIEPTASFPDAHFAVMPESLVEPLIKATCPPRVCIECGTPYDRESEVVSRSVEGGVSRVPKNERGYDDRQGFSQNDRKGITQPNDRRIGEWEKQCECDTDGTEPGIEIDPFVGAGTVCKVAKDHNRRFVGIDLNEEYVSMAQARCGLDVDDPSVLSDEGQDHLGSFAVTDGGS